MLFKYNTFLSNSILMISNDIAESDGLGACTV